MKSVHYFNIPICWEKQPTNREINNIKKVVKGIAIAEMENNGIPTDDIKVYEPRIVANPYGYGYRVLMGAEINFEYEVDRNGTIVTVDLKKKRRNKKW